MNAAGLIAGGARRGGVLVRGRRWGTLSLGGGGLLFVDLQFVAAIDDADAHHGEQVVCGVGVVVDTADESGASILADFVHEQVTTARVLVDE